MRIFTILFAVTVFLLAFFLVWLLLVYFSLWLIIFFYHYVFYFLLSIKRGKSCGTSSLCPMISEVPKQRSNKRRTEQSGGMETFIGYIINFEFHLKRDGEGFLNVFKKHVTEMVRFLCFTSHSGILDWGHKRVGYNLATK